MMDKASMEARAKKRGMEQGIRQGKQQGVMEGRENERKEIILNMHKEGLKVEDISKFLRMEKQEVEKIIKEENEKCRNCKKERN